jgi:hypothetical protein
MRRRGLTLAVAALVAVATSIGVVAAAKSNDRAVTKSPRQNDRAIAKSPRRFTGTFHTRTGAPFPPDQQVLADLRELALFVGSNSGEDDSPTGGRVWAASRERAAELAFQTRMADTDQPVYVVVLHGDFVLSDAPRPSGAPTPTASVLTMIVDPTTGGILDFGACHVAHELSALGEGVDLGVQG